MNTRKKRYAVAGLSSRAIRMFMEPMVNIYSNNVELVGLLDKYPDRANWFKQEYKLDIPVYKDFEFEEMIRKLEPDCIIIACPDAIHDEYIIKALKYNIDVICEKPLTTDIEKCTKIAEAVSKSKSKVLVTFNCRYRPETTKIYELIEKGNIGRVVSVDLNWYLDTYHGSSYFQRWNRMREISGGLCIHKSCHHFDLIRWMINQKPIEVFAYGALNFYGPDGVHNPLRKDQIGDGRTCSTCDVRNMCKYYMRWYRGEYRNDKNDFLVKHESHPVFKYDNYTPNKCRFDPEINIEDTYSAVIKYDGGAFLNYSLNASMPYEGFRLGINGTEGRIEYNEYHSLSASIFPESEKTNTITFIPMFGGRERINPVNLGGGHGGGDPLLRDELFIGPDKLVDIKRQADVHQGIEAVLTGVAVYKSLTTNMPVSIEKMKQEVYRNTGMQE